jgi:hypothetical protein
VNITLRLRNDTVIVPLSIRGVRWLFSRLTSREDVEEHRDSVQGFALVLIGQFVQLIYAKTSLEEGLEVGLEGTVLSVKGHFQVVSAVRAGKHFGFEI